MSVVDAVAAGLGALGAARLAPSRGPLVLMLHGLGGSDGLDPALFGAALDALAARRRVVPLGEAVRALGTREAASLASVTFDDGYVDFAALAVPALAARRLHATLFVPASHLGGWNAWDDGHAARRDILDAAGLRALDPAVVEIGAHGASHVRLRGLAAPALHAETQTARDALEAALDRHIRLFAYPYGQIDDFDAEAEAAVEKAGFLAACSTHFGRGSAAAERFRLRRVGIEPGDTPRTIARKLDGAYDFCAAKERFGAWRRGRLRG